MRDFYRTVKQWLERLFEEPPKTPREILNESRHAARFAAIERWKQRGE